MKPPCKHEANGVLVDCEMRCDGCRETCKKWSEYQAELAVKREQRRISCMLNEMTKERLSKLKGRDNQMSRMMKKRRQG